MKDSIVLYPALGRGHLVSMVELGKLILTQHPSLSITILILTPPSDTPSTPKGCDSTTSQYIAAVAAATPSITFHHLPPAPVSTTTLPPHILSLETSRASNHHLPHAITFLSKTLTLKAIVLDFMNFCAKQVTNTLKIPTFFYYTSGASTLATFLHLPTLHEATTKSIKELNTYLLLPGLTKIHLLDLPKEVHERTSQSYKLFLDVATSMRDSDGIIVNTCDAIEGRIIKALSEGLCFPEGTKTPQVFCIGPVISATCGEKDVNGCLSWLDSQPSQSVVLLSFGSLGRFSRAQVKEIAVGLEKSVQRFLWVLRSELEGLDSVEPSLNELLPEGFMKRTKGRGMVVRNWAPQVQILSHDSVGGFVTHCGWNSVLEAICEGVPMVAWPLYAEQRLNKVIMVHDMKVALAVNEDKDGFVSGTELEDRVRELMDSVKGKDIRQRVFEMKISAKKAKEEEGSSLLATQRLVQLWKQL